MVDDRPAALDGGEDDERRDTSGFNPTAKESVEHWIVEARNGSSEALGKVIDACRNYLMYVANAALSVELRAKIGPSDVVQDTSLEVHRDFKTFQGERLDELLNWMRRI